MKYQKLSAVVFLAFMFYGVPAMAGWYVRPYAGYTLELGESNSNFGVGAGVGYQFMDYLASTEVGYSRIFSDPDTDLLEWSGRVGLPLLPIYGLVGVGLFQTDVAGSDWESSYRAGAGFYLPFIPVLRIGAELSYLNLGGDTHLFNPVLTVGMGF